MPGWSPAVVAAMERALVRAGARGDDRADALDLLVELAADPECRAVDVLTRSGVDPGSLTARIGGPRRIGDPPRIGNPLRMGGPSRTGSPSQQA